MKYPPCRWAPVRSARAMVISLLLSSACAGCAAIGAIAYKTAGDRPIPAKYTLKKNEPLLVLMENYPNPDTVALSAAVLERRISDDLLEHKVARVVDPGTLADWRANRPKELAALSIPGIGKAVGARQIVYGSVSYFDIQATLASNMIKARAQVVVRVVDADTGATVWPTDVSGGEPIVAETPYVELKEGVSESIVRNRLIDDLAAQISRLFYPVRPSEIDNPESSDIKG